jgi:FMN-dependent NADH-azoreductase
MPRVLHIKASPRPDSASAGLAQDLLDAWMDRHDDAELDVWDLFEEELPAFNAPAARAKYQIIGGEGPTDAAGEAWREVLAVAERFKRADRYVLSSPMWNFGIPYRLKQLIDIIVQPAVTFTVSPETGYSGLLTGRRAALVLARGGRYGPGSGNEDVDFQQRYLKTILGFIGIELAGAVLVEPTLAEGPAAGEQARRAARQEARALAETL